MGRVVFTFLFSFGLLSFVEVFVAQSRKEISCRNSSFSAITEGNGQIRIISFYLSLLCATQERGTLKLGTIPLGKDDAKGRKSCRRGLRKIPCVLNASVILGHAKLCNRMTEEYEILMWTKTIRGSVIKYVELSCATLTAIGSQLLFVIDTDYRKLHMIIPRI